MPVSIVECSCNLWEDCLCGFHCLCTLCRWIQCLRHAYSDVPLLLRGRQLLVVHGVGLGGIVVAKMHHLTLFHIELHPPGNCPLTQNVQSLLKMKSLLRWVHCVAQLGVIGKLSQNVDEYLVPHKVKEHYWRSIQSCWYSRPSFVNCCPSYLLSGSTSILHMVHEFNNLHLTRFRTFKIARPPQTKT